MSKSKMLEFRRRREFRHCPDATLSAKSRAYGKQPPTISVSSDRTEMAAILGRTTDLSRLQSGRCPSGRASLCPTPSAFRQGGRHAVATQILHSRHVSLSLRRGPARRPSGRLHRHRHPRPLQTRAGISCVAPDGLGRVRSARRAIRRENRPASAQYHRGEHRHVQAADSVAWLQLRLVARTRHHRPLLFQVDAMDFPPALQLVVQSGNEQGRAD